MIKCNKCRTDMNGNESLIELHHVVPKHLGGTDKDGRIYLCHKCHVELHELLGRECKYKTDEWLKDEL